MRHFLIDTDTASDDAVALLMALKYPGVQVEAITLVAGNVPVEQGVQNALYTLELCGADAPVYQGAAKPLLRPLETAQFVHGQDGMGDIGLDLRGRSPEPGNAIDQIIHTIHQFKGEIEVVTLGPLTNIAIALLKEPELASLVKQCTIMGGVGQGHGNVTPISEYNIWTDPEAAHIVFSSGMNIQMVGWDISRNYACIDKDTCATFKNLDTPLAHFAMDIQQQVEVFSLSKSKLSGFDLPDPIAMAVALDQSVATKLKRLPLKVILSEGVSRGQTVIDHTELHPEWPKANIVWEASREKFLQILKDTLK